jgi:hypothetical protein
MSCHYTSGVTVSIDPYIDIRSFEACSVVFSRTLLRANTLPLKAAVSLAAEEFWTSVRCFVLSSGRGRCGYEEGLEERVDCTRLVSVFMFEVRTGGVCSLLVHYFIGFPGHLSIP